MLIVTGRNPWFVPDSVCYIYKTVLDLFKNSRQVYVGRIMIIFKDQVNVTLECVPQKGRVMELRHHEKIITTDAWNWSLTGPSKIDVDYAASYSHSNL